MFWKKKLSDNLADFGKVHYQTQHVSVSSFLPCIQNSEQKYSQIWGKKQTQTIFVHKAKRSIFPNEKETLITVFKGDQSISMWRQHYGNFNNQISKQRSLYLKKKN